MVNANDVILRPNAEIFIGVNDGYTVHNNTDNTNGAFPSYTNKKYTTNVRVIIITKKLFS